ncbi:MAG TPA: glycosyltransferase family 4 protein [Candidatus Didemnitutus sp.]|jgi:glycosyltransferase involved in cell wall biosynthesis
MAFSTVAPLPAMLECPTAYFHLDVPGAGQVLPAGRIALLGWLQAKPGRHYTDVRARIGSRCFPGILGFHRPDVAEFLGSSAERALVGFEIAILADAGRHEAVIEACSIDGTWEAITTIELDASGVAPRGAGNVGVPVRAREFGQALGVVLRRMAGNGGDPAAAARATVAVTPSPHYLRHAHLPLVGHLDQPGAWESSIFGRIPMTGWLLHSTARIVRVFATADLQAVQEMRVGRETGFLATRFAGHPQASHSGFDGFLDLPSQLPAPASVRVYAESSDGVRHLAFVVRVSTTDVEFAKQPYPRFSARTFWRGWRALRRESGRVPLPLESARARWPGVVSAWRDFAAQAPRQDQAPIGLPVPSPTTSEAPTIHLVSHNLGREGAPLFLLELARRIQRSFAARLVLTSGADGPLRTEFEALGAAVRIVDDSALLDPGQDPDPAVLERLAAEPDFSSATLVIANTLSTWWAITLAHRAGRRGLFLIHESTTPRQFFRGRMPASRVGQIEESFRRATAVSFLAPATERYFLPFSDRARHRIIPGWVDVGAIDRFRAAQPHDASRSAIGLPAGRRLVINPGTVCDRKGQHVFARAVDLLWRLSPGLAAAAEFWMIGGRDTAFDRELAEFVAALGHPNLRIVPETSAIFSYFGAADVFVCSSFEESFPRVVLEAMAFELPIVSSAVHAVPSMIASGQEGILVPPGDTAGLAGAMRRLLEAAGEGTAMARRARAKVAEYDSRRVLPRYVELVAELSGLPAK